MNKNILVSVIIPMYNSEKTIKKTIDSVINQDYKNLEIIIIDDGSEDKSYEIVSNLSKLYEIKLLKQENKGPSSARNLGLKNSNGEFIAFLDSDDCWINNKISKQLKIFLDNEKIGIVTTRIDNKKYCSKIENINFRKFLFSIKGFNINTPTVMIKRKIIEEIGYFNENIKYSEDAEYWFRILEKYDGIMINENLVYCGNGKKMFGEIGLSANLDKMFKGIILNYKRLLINKKIKMSEYILLILVARLKHYRRKIIVFVREKKCM